MGRIGVGVGARTGLGQRLALTPGLRQSLAVLRMPLADLVAELRRQAAANPHIVLHWPARTAGDDDRPEAAAGGPSLWAHVEAQIDATFRDPVARRIADAFARALAPSGWLETDVTAVAAETGTSPEAAARVLAQLQRFDPPGVFARSLAECLRLQAADAGILDAAMAALLDRLDLVAAGDVAALAAETGVAADVLRQRLAVLRRLDPKPGARFASPTPPVPAEVEVRPIAGGGFAVALNEAACPRITVRPGPAEEPAVRAAAALAAAVARRQETLLAISRHVFAHQAEALVAGPGALRPLTRADVARALGLSESTVSRAVAGTAVRTPRGTCPLADWFATPATEGVSAAAAKAALRRAIAAEPPGAPLSDAALAAVLREAGIDSARRTVAKYRATLGIPPAAARRRRQP
jgi:RNA polymerase sigma-54 factor